MTTSECNPIELGTASVWQKGPDFLYQDFSEWPVKHNAVPDLPDVVFVRVALNTEEITMCNQLIDYCQ